MAKTHDFWDTRPFTMVSLDYKLTVPMFRADDAVADMLKHLIQLNKVPFEASPLGRIFYQLNFFFSEINGN